MNHGPLYIIETIHADKSVSRVEGFTLQDTIALIGGLNDFEFPRVTIRVQGANGKPVEVCGRCPKQAEWSVINGGTMFYQPPSFYCIEHKDQMMADTMFPENYLPVRL